MLAIARQFQPHLKQFLMNVTTFNKYQQFAVEEKIDAGETSPVGLTETEANLYQRLRKSSKGRLEQEFIDRNYVKMSLEKLDN